jgi:hypothetical protein
MTFLFVEVAALEPTLRHQNQVKAPNQLMSISSEPIFHAGGLVKVNLLNENEIPKLKWE